MKIKLVKIGAKLFPDRYKEYTNFIASYGIVAINGLNTTLFLDARYNTSAQQAGVNFEPLANVPCNGVILDPFEWSISEFQRFGFENVEFETSDLSNDINLSDEDKTVLIKFLKEYNQATGHKYYYLISNIMHMKTPTEAILIDENGQMISGLDKPQEIDKTDILFDTSLTCVAHLKYLDDKNNILDPIRASESIMDNTVQYQDFLDKESIIWVKFWREIEENYKNMSEIDAANLLHEGKIKVYSTDYKLAFETIVGNNGNAAAIHGRASSKMLEDGVLLIDSGANYGSYNSDITRVFLLGNASLEMKNAYTKTLQAHIAVASYTSVEKIQAVQLDQIARKYVQFEHALGHGVGKAVHAFPTISGNSKEYLEHGMILAIEPGVYYPGKFGIRLESLMQVVFDNGYYMLKYLTYVPFEYDLIDCAQLSKEETAWLSNFHKICYKKLIDKDIANSLLNNFDIEFLNAKIEKFIHKL